MKTKTFEQWKDMSGEINQKEVRKSFEGAMAGVSREVRTEEEDYLYRFSSLVPASERDQRTYWVNVPTGTSNPG